MTLEALDGLRDWIIGRQRDLELQDFISAAVLDGDWEPRVDRARSLLAGYSGRLGLHGPFQGLHLANPDPELRAIVTRRIRQGLTVCEALGATQMVIHSPYTTWDYNNLDNTPGQEDRIIALAHDTLSPVLDQAEGAGITMVIENIEDKDPDARCRLADSFDSDAVAVSLDTGHAHYAHGTTGAPPVDYYIHRAGDRLSHIHLQDADGYADRHWQIGQGTVNWPAIFDALNACGGDPRLILEIRDPAAIVPSADWLRDRGLAA